MNIRRWGLAQSVVALFILSAVAFVPVVAQQQGQKVDKKTEKAQQFDLQSVVSAMNAAMEGETLADFTMTFRNDALKAQEGKTYVPFTITFDQAQAPAGKALTMFTRVVNKALVAAAPPADAKKGKGDKSKNLHPEYVYQDASFINLTPPASATEPYQISRAFAVPAGEYDVYVALIERLPVDAKDREKTRVKAGVMKQTITVPNYWSDELTTSTIIVADKVEPLSAPLTQREQIEHPYTLGSTQIVPSLTNTFSKKHEISVVFLIYNPVLGADKKPDVSVDYSFYQKVASETTGEKFFNKTNPQVFSAKTLPPQFDPAMGHQLVAGQSLPLGSFAEGEWRLEIKVTDKLSGKSITHNVKFVVTA
ncbi:MAG: hypothetical protein R6V57_05520 [Vicinamibacterales bacterium]